MQGPLQAPWSVTHPQSPILLLSGYAGPPLVASQCPSSYPVTSPFLGGGSLFAIHGDCEAYDTRTDRWHVVASMSTRRARVGVAAVGNRLYAVGG